MRVRKPLTWACKPLAWACPAAHQSSTHQDFNTFPHQYLPLAHPPIHAPAPSSLNLSTHLSLTCERDIPSATVRASRGMRARCCSW